MPGLALIFARDGAPVDARRLSRMAARLDYRGAGVTTWIDGPIGLAQLSTAAPPRPIAQTADGRWRALFDGRLDNRDELAGELGLSAADRAGDAAVAVHACARWGRDAGPRLRGDFALAAWHAAERQVILLRDIRGLKPLFFRLDERELCCASDLRALAGDRHSAVNDGMVAEWLTGAPASHRETLYAGIARLPMAHVAVIDARSARESQYWMPSIDATLAARSDAERAERFSALLSGAVRERGATDPVAVMLSGGLDSSSVAAAVTSAGARVAAFTLAGASDADDESAQARAVAAHLGAAHTVVRGRPVSLRDAAADAAFSLDIPAPPNGLQSLALRRRVAGDGHRVALSGLGSDEWFGGSFLLYADQARRGALTVLARTVWADRHRDEPTRVRLQIAAWALCPPWIKDPLRRVLRRPRPTALLSPSFARRTCLADRLRAVDIAPPPLPSLSQQALYAENTCGAYVAATEMQERGNARAGLDERYPFHDRRMIEFSLGLPESDRWADGRYKGVIRRAMANRLPAAVIGRQTSPNANALLAQTLQSAGRPFFEQLQVTDRGWVDRRRVLDAWDAFAREPRSAQSWDLWAVAAMELWCRHALEATTTTGEHSSVA